VSCIAARRANARRVEPGPTVCPGRTGDFYDNLLFRKEHQGILTSKDFSDNTKLTIIYLYLNGR
jgi:hypothetical protein